MNDLLCVQDSVFPVFSSAKFRMEGLGRDTQLILWMWKYNTHFMIQIWEYGWLLISWDCWWLWLRFCIRLGKKKTCTLWKYSVWFLLLLLLYIYCTSRFFLFHIVIKIKKSIPFWLVCRFLLWTTACTDESTLCNMDFAILV